MSIEFCPSRNTSFNKSQRKLRLEESLEHNVENTNSSISQQNENMGEPELNSDDVPDPREVVCKRLLSKEGAISGGKARGSPDLA